MSSTARGVETERVPVRPRPPPPDPQVGDGVVSSLRQVLRWHWLLIVAVAVPVAAGAIAYAEQLPPVYEARAVVVIEPTADAGGSGPAMVRLAAPTFVEYVTAPATLREIAADLGITTGTLTRAIDAEVATDTGNLAITAESRDPELAAVMVAAAADRTVAFSTADTLVRARTVVPAVVPDDPSGPPRRLIEAAALAVGLLAGVGLALIVARLRPRVRTAEDLSALTDLRVIGQVPRSRRLSSNPMLAFGRPDVGAAVRALRLHVESGVPSGGVIVITSPLAREGKSTIAAMLAVALGRVDLRVLLIEGDLRRPGLEGLPPTVTKGTLVDVLRGRLEPRTPIRPGWVKGVDILPGAQDPDASDLITRRFWDVVAACRDGYDLVMVDAPPLLGTDEARALAIGADEVLLVVSAGTRWPAVVEAASALAALRTRMMGAVLNRSAGWRAYDLYR